MGTLYDIAMNLREIIDALDDCETDEEVMRLCEQADAAEADLNSKAESYVKIIRNFETDIDALKSEKERLNKLQKRRELAIERMKEYIRAAMTASGLQRIETRLGKWSRRMSPWSCKVINADKVPEKYLIPQPPVVDKKALLNDFKQTGEIADGVDFEQREYVMFR